MGIDYSTHIGPYVECKTHKEPKEYETRSCTNIQCKNHRNSCWDSKKFCNECGSEIGKVKITKNENFINRQIVSEEMEEALFWPAGDSMYDWSKQNDTDLWLPNRRRSGGRSFHFDPKEDIVITEITPEMMAQEIEEFIDQYRSEINTLRKHYGLENVTIKWGVIHAIS